jgi:hypothetical protein
VLEGEVEMEKNYTLEPWEMEKGFVLTCQARAVTPRVVVSYDERRRRAYGGNPHTPGCADDDHMP